MFGRLMRLIFAPLVIIISTHSSTYALQTIQAGEYSFSYKGGDFDKSIMKGSLTGVTFYHHQIKVASAKSVYFDHNFKDANFDIGDGDTEAQIKLSFENLTWLVEESANVNVDKGAIKFSINYNNRRMIGGQFSLSSANLNFQADLPLQSNDQAPALNKFKGNVGSVKIRASIYPDRADLNEMALNDVKLDWANGGFGASLKNLSMNDFVFGYEMPENSQKITQLFGLGLGADFGEWQMENLKVTFAKGFQNKIDVISIPNWTINNCRGYSLLIKKVQSHVCSASSNNISINKKAVEQLFPEFAEALSQNGIKDIMSDIASQTSVDSIKDVYNIEHISSIAIDNIGTVEFRSSVSTNQKLFSEMVALEKRLPSVDDSQTIYLNELLNLLDMTFLHEYNVIIKDDGLLEIVHSFIKNKSPAFREMSRYQLSVEAERMITEALQEQPGASSMVNPSISRFISGSGEISLRISPLGDMSVHERAKLISDFDDFVTMFNVRLVN